MAKKSVRLLSLLLTVLMLVTMIPVVASAEYDYAAVEAPENYVIIDYGSLVGEANQETATDVYVVDADWDFAVGEEPEKVTFMFQNKQVTEKYDKTRHLKTVADVYAQAKLDGVKMPKAILTAGNYSEKITLNGSIYLLGARAGINPNVPNADPSAKWELSAERALADYGSADSLGETRFWIEGEIDVAGGYGGAGSSYTERLLTNAATGAVEYVFDGLVLQGYGAVVHDTTGGSGTRQYKMQNCILNNGWSYDVSTFRLWNRYCTSSRELSISNCYATGYKQLGLYSGHASKIEINGLCWQDNYAGLCYDVEHIQQLGLNFSLQNSHFWNSEAAASSDAIGGMFHYDRLFYSDFNQGTASYLGTNSEPYRYTINNNSFWNMEFVQNGGFVTGYNLFEIPMGGENEKIVFTNNVFGNTMANAKRHPLQIRYLTVNGAPSHTAEVPTLSDSTTLYALNSNNVEIANNTFVGKVYTNLTPEIGNNSAEDTLVEMTGNFYTTSLDSHTGTFVEGKFGDIIYDKWVWTDNSEAGKLDPKNRTDYINEEAFTLGGLTQPTVDPEDPYHYIYNVGSKSSVMVWGSGDNSAGVNNIVKFYTADEEYNKLAELTASSLTAPERENYYVAALLSRDRRTSVDYKITVVRDVYAGAELAGIKEDAYPEIKFLASDETDMDLFTYVVGYENEDFNFALDVADDATTVVYGYNARGNRYQLQNNGTENHYYFKLTETEKVYPFEIEVTSAAGKTEKYAMEVSRGLNNEAALEEVVSEGNTVTKDEANKTYTVTVPVATEEVDFGITVSSHATSSVLNNTTGYPITATNGVYNAKIKVGTQSFTVTVVSQDQQNTEEWVINVVRPASTEKEVLNVENATKVGNGWEADVESENFIVFATVSPLASYAIYSDAECTQKIGDANVVLVDSVTLIYIQVTAEDGSKAVVVLTVTTTVTGTPVPGQPGMYGNGVIAVSGATGFNGNTVYVDLGPNAKNYNFRIVGLDGYTVKVFGDQHRTLWAPLEMTIVPDTGVTNLYVIAKKGETEINYDIEIVTEIPVDFTDSIVPWAQPYVDALEESMCGIIKGDEHGAFNGAKNLTRYEMAVMMVRLTGVNKDLYKDVKLPFADTIVPWAENYVKAAYRIDLVGGYSITDSTGAVTGFEYRGGNIATRSEFLKVYMNAIHGGDITEYYNANKKRIDDAVKAKNFADQADVAEWAIPYVYTAIYEGMITGDGNRINPNGNITRYEASAILCRYLDLV